MSLWARRRSGPMWSRAARPRLGARPRAVATSRSSLFVGGLTARGHTVSFPDVLLLAPHGTEGFSAAQLKVVRGRVADPGAVDEAMAGYVLAERLGLRPGDTMTVAVSS